MKASLGFDLVFPTKQSQDLEIFQGATPWSTPATKLADSETASRFAPVAVNDWEPENVTGLVDTAKTLRFPKQYSVQYLAQFKQSSKAWHKYRIVNKTSN